MQKSSDLEKDSVMTPHIVVIDGMNFLHRARSGWQLGPAPVIFNFFRNFRSIVELLKPTRIYFVLEGRPQQRIDAHPTYKANRTVDVDSKEYVEQQKFFKQVDTIVETLKKCFPITVVRHPSFECDDTIYNLIKRSSSAIPWTVVSNDSDFTQLLNEFRNVKIYNPMMKKYVTCPDYCYVTWKSIRGDNSDNIPGIPGIGDKGAIKLLEDPDALKKVLDVPENGKLFEKNYKLIKFIDWSDEDACHMTSSTPIKNWSEVRELFETHQFSSLLKESTWAKFVETFDSLWS